MIVGHVTRLGFLPIALLVVSCSSSPQLPDLFQPDGRGLSPELANSLQQARSKAASRSDDAEALVTYARTLAGMNESHGAAQTFELAARRETEDARWPYLAALSWIEAGEFSRAAEQLQLAHSLAPDYAAALLHAGYVHLQLGDFAQARSEFERASGQTPYQPAVDLALAELSLAEGAPAEAQATLQTLLAGNPDPYLYLQLANASRQLGQAERAADFAARVRPPVRRPQWPDPWRESFAPLQSGRAAVVQRAERALAEGHPQTALDALLPLYASDAVDRPVLQLLATSYQALGQADAAFQLLEEGASRYPDDAEFLNRLAGALYERGQFDEALQTVERALASQPSRASSNALRARMMMRRGQPNEAMPSYEKALRSDPTDPKILGEAAGVALRQGNWTRAQVLFDRWSRVQPGRFEAWLGLAGTCLENGESECARSSFARAEKIQPNAPQLRALRTRLEQLR